MQLLPSGEGRLVALSGEGRLGVPSGRGGSVCLRGREERRPGLRGHLEQASRRQKSQPASGKRRSASRSKGPSSHPVQPPNCMTLSA